MTAIAQMPALPGIVLLLWAALLLQGYCMAYDYFRWQYNRDSLWEGLMDGSVLLWLGLSLYLAAGAGTPFILLRRILAGLTAGLSMLQALRNRKWRYLFSGCLGLLLLPSAEGWLGWKFPMAFSLGIFLWLLRACGYIGIYRRERRERLSAFSVKEAVDTMNFGILFYREQGQILLANRRFQWLMYALTGETQYSGREFFARLAEGRVLPGCTRKSAETALLYTLPDGSVWRFDREEISGEDGCCTLLIASDMSRYSWTMDRLTDQNRELQQRNRELKTMLRNLEQLCLSEETLRAKSRVHDLLGQQISLVLRSIREHREPEDSLLQSLQEGLPDQLKQASGDCLSSLRMAAESFRSLGVRVRVEGEPPRDPELQKMFYEIAAEAMTNAVHHGYATEIQISMEHRSGQWRLKIRDNGKAASGPVVEGGGLRSMRRKAEALGGQFSYCTTTHFSILVTVPEGGTI